jgi:hypothetical protein
LNQLIHQSVGFEALLRNLKMAVRNFVTELTNKEKPAVQSYIKNTSQNTKLQSDSSSFQKKKIVIR